MNKNEIKALLIDFGGVIYNINTNLSINAFKELIKNNNSNNNSSNIHNNNNYLKISDSMKINYQSMPFMDEYEQGKISTDEFLHSISNLLKIDNTKESLLKIINAWNLTLIGLKPNIQSVLEKLSADYNLYLLSNTNELHYNYFIDECKTVFDRYFQKLFFSYKMGCNKPKPEIFKNVINSIKFKPNEILFIDDSIENINSANLLNFNTYHINNEDKTIFNLSDYLHSV